MQSGKIMKKNIAIIEFSAWHDECLFTTCLLLKAEGYRVTLLLNQDLQTRIGNSLDEVSDEIRYYPFKKGGKGVLAAFSLYNHLLRGGFTHVYFNSAQGSVTWKFFLLPFPKRIKMLGTIHNVKKLTSSTGQKFITRRIDSYVLLSDLLTKRYQEVCDKPSAAIYPVFYPTFNTSEISKKPGEVWIVIPGAVSLGRRDYLALLDRQAAYAPHIRFIILGNRNKADGNLVYERVCQAGLQDNFKFFDKFVPEEEFYAYVSQCDYIMPLIHPCHKEYAKYLTEKISGTYNLAIAYQKTMLCPQEMNVYEDFQDTSLFYPMEELPTFINSLSPLSDKQLFQLPKWRKEVQQARLAKLLAQL